MEIIKACGIIICVVCKCVIFNCLKPEYSLFIRLLITIGAGLLSLSIFHPILKFINEISNGTKIQEYFPVLLKALGISMLVEITSDICKDSGEGAMAQRIEIIGKAEIIYLCVPLIKDILQLCESIV